MDYTAASMVELIRSAQAGSRGALEHLLRRSRAFIQIVVQCRGQRRIRARVGVSDVVQDALLAVARGVEGFRGAEEREWLAWIRRIAEREVNRQTKRHVGAARRSVGREVGRLVTALASAIAAPKDPSAFFAGSGGSWDRADRAAAAAVALTRLPTDYRQVLILRNLQGLEFPKVAIQMKRSTGAVRMLWVRAVRRLQEELGAAAEHPRGPIHG